MVQPLDVTIFGLVEIKTKSSFNGCTRPYKTCSLDGAKPCVQAMFLVLLHKYGAEITLQMLHPAI